MTWRDDRDLYRLRTRRSGDFGATLARFRAYLAGRPAESWAFFAAGFVLALILF